MIRDFFRTADIRKIIIMLSGVIVCSFGLSMDQTADVGISQYDSLPLILHEKYDKISYFWYRVIADRWKSWNRNNCGCIGVRSIHSFFNHNFTGKIIKKATVRYSEKKCGDEKI